jgi:2-(1,2-epoxy-1,2-dihydrophenyl)acetyl-CoA isomerase
MSAPVLVADDGPVRTITLNRPERLNALDDPCRRALLSALEDAAEDDAVRVIVLTGAGRAFCTGQDVTASEELEDAGATVSKTYNPLARILRAIDKMVIASVHGPAVGAGLGLALACDIRIMGSDAYLACSFSRVGLVPDTGTTVALLRRLGHAHAFAVAVSGRKIGAEEALAVRLVNEVVDPPETLDRALAVAHELAAGPAEAQALTKELLVAADRLDEFELLDLEARAQGIAAASDFHREAVDAFLERAARRPPADGDGSA